MFIIKISGISSIAIAGQEVRLRVVARAVALGFSAGDKGYIGTGEKWDGISFFIMISGNTIQPPIPDKEKQLRGNRQEVERLGSLSTTRGILERKGWRGFQL
jgi:hypothetical protein